MDEKKESVKENVVMVQGPSLWQVITMLLLMMTLTSMVWLCTQVWMINKFLIVLSIGEQRMQMYGYPPIEESSADDLTKGLDPRVQPTQPPVVYKRTGIKR